MRSALFLAAIITLLFSCKEKKNTETKGKDFVVFNEGVMLSLKSGEEDEKGNYEEARELNKKAIEKFREALKINPNHEGALEALSFCLKNEDDFRKALKLPLSFSTDFNNKGLAKKYQLIFSLDPSFLNADFNGDNINDTAVLVMEKATEKYGVIIRHGHTNDYFTLGAGKAFGNGGDDFKWIKYWNIFNKPTADETVFDKDDNITGSKEIKLSRPALELSDPDASSGVSSIGTAKNIAGYTRENNAVFIDLCTLQ